MSLGVPENPIDEVNGVTVFVFFRWGFWGKPNDSKPFRWWPWMSTVVG